MTLAKVNEQYALKVIDPAIPPENYFKPNRKLLIVLDSCCGAVVEEKVPPGGHEAYRHRAAYPVIQTGQVVYGHNMDLG